MTSQRLNSQRTVIAIAAAIFTVCAAATAAGSRSMAAMGEMAMPGDWMMSMTWMPMAGQSWPGAACNFLGMWMVMMVAMMLPSLLPRLVHYRAGFTARAGSDWLTVAVGVGYFSIWALVGLIIFALGVTVAGIEMQSARTARVVPMVVGAIMIVSGVLQFSRWKARRLACCRSLPAPCSPPAIGPAWRHGMRLGFYCTTCCAGLTVALLAAGVMDLKAMAVIAVATTAERLAPAHWPAAQAIGVVMIAAGLLAIAQAAMKAF
jgi:predicted metal-binding membrane protein